MRYYTVSIGKELLHSLFLDSLTLNVGTLQFFGTSVGSYQSIWCHGPEESTVL